MYIQHHKAISLCVIDDIRSVVEGITAIDWQEYGISVAGVSLNGEQGLTLVKEVKPDIIITDIRMPRMDGLKMVRAIQEMKHECKVILISSYTDFEYAQQAVQLGAFDFIVKPFTETHILSAVLKARDEVLKERVESLNQKELEYKVRESLPLLRQEYLSLLIQHQTSWRSAAERWSFLGIHLEPENLRVMLIEIDRFDDELVELPVHEVELLRFSLQNILEETLARETKSIVFRVKGNLFVAVMNDPIRLTAGQLAERCCQNIARYSKYTVSIGLGGWVNTLELLPESYRQADRALTYHLFTGGNGSVSYEELPMSDRQIPLSMAHKDDLLLALRSGNGERAFELVTQLSKTVQDMRPSPHPNYLSSLYEELAAAAIRTLYELVPQSELQPLVDRFRVDRRAPGPALAGWNQRLGTLVLQGAELIRKNSLSEGQAIIYRSLEYLRTHLDRNISVLECASYVHLSASYYSSLFKKVTGMTLIQYVTAERIDRAKAMIIDGIPVQDVAAAVGYEERRYFSEMFKRETGMTPSEFKEGYSKKVADA